MIPLLSKSYKFIRSILTIVITLALTAFILSTLLSIHPPKASFDGFDISNKSFDATVTVKNENWFRSYNVTLSLLQVWYTRNGENVEGPQLGWTLLQEEKDMVGSRDNKKYKYTNLARMEYRDVVGEYYRAVKGVVDDGSFNLTASLYILYQYKIMAWRTKTYHSAFFDINVHGDFEMTGEFLRQKDYNRTVRFFP